MLLETDRLQLRFLNRLDVDDVLVYQSDPESVRYIPWEARNREQVIEGLIKAEACLGLDTENQSLMLAVVLKETGRVIGQLNSKIVDAANNTANIGYVINQNYRGQGYCAEAVSWLLDDIFNVQNVHRVIADIDVRNESSVRVVERLGFRREATFIENDYLKGEWCSMYLYALLSREWRSN
jgi:RimJ/RimL family protein N-acetyltransferase